MIKTFTKFNEDEELNDFEEDLIVEKPPVTADAMKRYKAGKAGFTDKAHLKAKGLIPRADGSKVKSDKYKEKKMKTFKEHLKEGNVKSNANKYGAGTTGTSTSNAVEDSSLGTANLKDPSVLKRVNAFVGSVADMEYIKPQQAVDKLRENLMRIGLDISPVKLEGDAGTVTAEVKQFGGTYGKTTETKPEDVVVDNGPGIDNLKLEVKFETLSNGSSKVYAKLV